MIRSITGVWYGACLTKRPVCERGIFNTQDDSCSPSFPALPAEWPTPVRADFTGPDCWVAFGLLSVEALSIILKRAGSYAVVVACGCALLVELA